MDEMIKVGTKLNLLSLEDSIGDYEIICEKLIDAGYDLKIVRVEKENDFVAALNDNKYDAILVDFNLPGFNAFGALQICNEICSETPFICVSGSIGEETAIELLKAGAVDYVLKDRLERLPFAVKRALDEAEEKETRRHTEAALRESEKNYKTLADSGLAMIWTAETNKQCNYFNRVWLDFRGRNLEQEIGDGWTEGVHPDDLEFCLATYIAAFDKRKKISMEYRLKRYDGEYRWIVDEGCPRYNTNDKFIGYIGHCMDITERMKAQEDLLKKMDELQRFYNLTVGRELTMIELKKEINGLLRKLGEKEKYKIIE
ncbi:MAG: PAS domain S-box protein [bacterium]